MCGAAWHAQVGSFDAGYGCTQMARLVGQKKAREMWFLARLYDARQARQRAGGLGAGGLGLGGWGAGGLGPPPHETPRARPCAAQV